MRPPFDWTLWGLLALAAALEFAGDLLLKWWAETNNWLSFGAGVLAYVASLAIFAMLLRRADLSVIFALWVGLAAVLTALAGWLLFGEAITPRRIAGILLVIGGVILLSK
ncbi:MAG: EamA family transporter [Anaerolineae bacterium]|nr:EamA family transporter [Anaerolineae bacterium]